MKGCEFCKLLLEKENPFRIVDLNLSAVFLNKDQLFLGSVLIISKKHAEELDELSQDERGTFIEDMVKVGTAIKKGFNPAKLNYALLGNIVPHLHWYIIPRYKNDPNWNNPPWPHQDKYLNEEQYRTLVEKIRRFLPFI